MATQKKGRGREKESNRQTEKTERATKEESGEKGEINVEINGKRGKREIAHGPSKP